MPYPEEYKDKQNYFETKIDFKVIDKVKVIIPEYSLKSNQGTHIYLLPPNTRTKVEVVGSDKNRDIKL